MQLALLLSLALGCRSVELNFAITGGSGLTFDRAEARVSRYTLAGCEEEAGERRLRRRLDLLDPRPVSVRDGAWCGLEVEFRDEADALHLSGETDEGTPFEIDLSPGTIAVDDPFGGEGEELVLVLDTDPLFTGSDLDQQAELTGYVDVDADSPVGQEWAASLDRALSVAPLGSAERRADWLLGSALAAPAADDRGCGGADTGYYAEPEPAAGEPASSGGCAAEEDEPEESGGGCEGGDTGEESSDEEGSESSEDKGGGCSDGGGDTGARLGAAGLALLAWRLRRSRRASPR